MYLNVELYVIETRKYGTQMLFSRYKSVLQRWKMGRSIYSIEKASLQARLNTVVLLY